MFNKARVINTLGNRAVHSHRVVPIVDAEAAVRELFHVAYWLARTYGRVARPAPGLMFDPSALPKPSPLTQQSAEQLRALEASLRERDEKLAALLSDRSALDEELKRLRTEVAEAKKAAAAQPDTHNYSETETRDYFIDLLLKEAGWPLNQKRDREFEVRGIPMLEIIRRRLRELVKLIEKQKRRPIYTDFEDEMGGEIDVALPYFGEGADYAKFRAKAQAFLRAHQDHVTIRKLRMNKPLTAADLEELERMLSESGIGRAEDISRAKAEAHGLGLFVRSLVGMDREAAKQALARFLSEKTFRANQIEFVNLIVNHLTEHGLMEAARLY